MARKLKPPKNYRNTWHRCCARCKYWSQLGGNTADTFEGYACDRPGGPEGDWNANEPEFHVCDGFKWEGK